VRDRGGLDGAELGDTDLKVREQFQQERLELLVGAIDFVDQQHRGRDAANGGEQRPFQQVFFREDVLFNLVGIFADAFAGFDRQELALIVPLVERRILVEAFVALQPDQLGAMHGGERLGDLGLADAGFAFEQQRALQKLHQPQRGRDIAVGDIADGGELVGDVFAIEGHGTRNTPIVVMPREGGAPSNRGLKELTPSAITGSSGRAGR
jgi:hypothetical protein